MASPPLDPDKVHIISKLKTERSLISEEPSMADSSPDVTSHLFMKDSITSVAPGNDPPANNKIYSVEQITQISSNFQASRKPSRLQTVHSLASKRLPPPHVQEVTITATAATYKPREVNLLTSDEPEHTPREFLTRNNASYQRFLVKLKAKQTNNNYKLFQQKYRSNPQPTTYSTCPPPTQQNQIAPASQLRSYNKNFDSAARKTNFVEYPLAKRSIDGVQLPTKRAIGLAKSRSSPFLLKNPYKHASPLRFMKIRMMPVKEKHGVLDSFRTMSTSQSNKVLPPIHAQLYRSVEGGGISQLTANPVYSAVRVRSLRKKGPGGQYNHCPVKESRALQQRLSQSPIRGASLCKIAHPQF